MKFVTVDNNKQRLIMLEELLKTHFPDCVVTEFTDPMLSAKFIYNNDVDMVFAQEEMGRVNGDGLKQVIMLNKPYVNVRLFREIPETADCILSLKE